MSEVITYIEVPDDYFERVQARGYIEDVVATVSAVQLPVPEEDVTLLDYWFLD